MRRRDGAGGRRHAMPRRARQRAGGGALRHDVMRSLVQCLVSRAPDRRRRFVEMGKVSRRMPPKGRSALPPSEIQWHRGRQPVRGPRTPAFGVLSNMSANMDKCRHFV